ncbi:MAG: hydrogenase maturation nickel metallochaperone HypA [Oscillospiraceae bacterium]|nr:hydrogenase maturation nickel metallochaperone HypA [Oscillospiraceae bacterium]
MSFLDNVINTTKNAAATAGKKTDEAFRISKLKVKTTQLNNDIKDKYEKLGALVYEMAKSGNKDNEAFDALIEEIDAANAELEDIGRQLDELKGVVACAGCGAKTAVDNAFCPKCGAKLPEKTVEAPAEADVIDEDKGE